MSHCSTSSLLLCVAVFAAIAAEPPQTCRAAPGLQTTELQQKVDKLVGQLDAQTRVDRAAARDGLLQLGPSILPLLPHEEALASAAPREAIRQIRQHLERQAALDTLAPSRVTIHGKLPLGKILKRIEAQSGNRFVLRGIDKSVLQKEYSVDDKSRTFWSACDDLVERAGLVHADGGTRGYLKVRPTSGTERPRELAVANQGAIRVSVVSAEIRSSPADPAHRLLRIVWAIVAEPRLRPLFARIAPSELVVRTTDSAALAPVSPGAKLEISMASGQSLRLDSDFEIPKGVNVPSVNFSGSLRVEMAAGSERFDFDSIASHTPQTKRVAEVAVTLRRAEIEARIQQHSIAGVGIVVAYQHGGPAFESYRTWIFQNEASLESKSGHRIAPQPLFSTDRQGDGSVAIEYNFANVVGNLDDYHFVYVAPTLITEWPVDFRFAKLPVTQLPANQPLEGKHR